MKTYYVDVTQTIGNQLFTGIQRVVRKISSNLIETAEGSDIDVVLVVAVGNRFHRLSPKGHEALLVSDPKAGDSLIGGGKLRRVVKQSTTAIPRLYDIIRKVSFAWELKNTFRGYYDSNPLEVQPRDIIVLLDAFWGGSSALRAAAQARLGGTKVISVVYDMVAVTHPQFQPRIITSTFSRAIVKAAELSTGMLAISRSCADQLKSFLAKHSVHRPVRHFYLGYDVAGDGDIGAKARALADKLQRKPGPAYLAVGTIEPRKDHATILSAFDLIWQDRREAKLIIVGKVGWANPELIRRLREHPQLDERLFLFHSASDSDLCHLMKRTDAAIIASHAEGFGLPLVECLAAGLPVIASDIDVFREIAGDKALYFRTGDPHSLKEAICAFEANKDDHRRSAASFSWLNWRESASGFLCEIDNIVESANKSHAPDRRDEKRAG